MHDLEPPPDLSRIHRALHRRSVVRAMRDEQTQYAAVALVLCEEDPGNPELLFIERARRAGDSWSGDMAFPGGRREPHDDNSRTTALRETFEEVGVRLGDPVGRLDDYDARSGRLPWPLVVTPYVYTLDRRPLLRTNHEVNETVWIPLTSLLDPSNATRHRFRKDSAHVSSPAVRHDRFVIWGMTYRILTSFFRTFGRTPAAGE